MSGAWAMRQPRLIASFVTRRANNACVHQLPRGRAGEDLLHPQCASATDGPASVRVTVALLPALKEEFCGLANVDFLELGGPPARRFWFEQSALSGLIRSSHADVLLSTGNFALRKSPVPQILLSRNSIYTSADYYRDLRSRHEYRAWLDTHLRAALAKRSMDGPMLRLRRARRLPPNCAAGPERGFWPFIMDSTWRALPTTPLHFRQRSSKSCKLRKGLSSCSLSVTTTITETSKP